MDTKKNHLVSMTSSSIASSVDRVAFLEIKRIEISVVFLIGADRFVGLMGLIGAVVVDGLMGLGSMMG